MAFEHAADDGYHTELMQRAAHAMHHLPADDRYISALTLSASAATAAEVRRRVIQFRQQLIALCDADPRPSRVVQLNLQLFPLSRPILAPPGAERTEPSTEPARARRAASRSRKIEP